MARIKIGAPDRIYYGWIMVPLCMITLMLVVGTTSNAYPLYVLPLSHDYGLSRASANTGMILMNAGSAVSALIVGPLLDRFPVRAIMGISALILGASLIILGLSHNLWVSAAVLALPVGFAMSGIGTLTAPALVARWFTVHRGRAMAILMMGNSLGTILMVPPHAWLIDRLGWRETLVAMGVGVVVLIFALLPFVRSMPGADDREIAGRATAVELPAGEIATPQTHLTSRQLLANPRFWAIAFSTGIGMGVFMGILVSTVPLGRGFGLSNTVAASLISVMGMTAIVAKIGIAFIGDRFDRAYLLAGAYSLMAVASMSFLFAQTYPTLLVSCTLLGIATGVAMPLYLTLLVDQFGPRSFGSATGYITFMISVLGACAYRFSGEVFDRTGNYRLMFVTFIFLSMLAAVLVLSVRRRAADIADGAPAFGHAGG